MDPRVSDKDGTIETRRIEANGAERVHGRNFTSALRASNPRRVSL